MSANYHELRRAVAQKRRWSPEWSSRLQVCSVGERRNVAVIEITI
jgi:hypothetical protein